MAAQNALLQRGRRECVQGRQAAAEQAFRQAIDYARLEGSPVVRLLALTALASLWRAQGYYRRAALLFALTLDAVETALASLFHGSGRLISCP